MTFLIKQTKTLQNWFSINGGTYRNHLAFGGHVCGAVAQAQFGLQGVEVGLQLGFLLHAWWFVFTPVSNGSSSDFYVCTSPFLLVYGNINSSGCFSLVFLACRQPFKYCSYL